MADLPKLNKWCVYLLWLLTAVLPASGWAAVAATPDIAKLDLNGQSINVTLLPEADTAQVVYKLRPVTAEEWDNSIRLEVSIDRVKKVTLSIETPYLILNFHEAQPIVLGISAHSDAAMEGKELRARLWGDSDQAPILLKVQTKAAAVPEQEKTTTAVCQNSNGQDMADASGGLYWSEFASYPAIRVCNRHEFPVQLQYNFYQLEFDEDGSLRNRQPLNAQEFQTDTKTLAAGEQSDLHIIPSKQHRYFVLSLEQIRQEGERFTQIGADVFVFTRKSQTLPDYRIAAATFRRVENTLWLDVALSNQDELPFAADIELQLRNSKNKPVIRGKMLKTQPVILPQQEATFSLEFPGFAEYQHQPLTADIYVTLAGKYQRKHVYAITIH
ncbi:hypothetical protein SAMN05660964_02560 [Thiothrix caldifontis]|uniref:Uncharacterized protein n=1 Tax=Thiothrix caldifontis TaxID=525918 RepID=A0A1H4EES4_9GAMM|nr:hypothetical protein SAMN05660964_02560 [Thiothrix caldifontis]